MIFGDEYMMYVKSLKHIDDFRLCPGRMKDIRSFGTMYTANNILVGGKGATSVKEFIIQLIVGAVQYMDLSVITDAPLFKAEMLDNDNSQQQIVYIATKDDEAFRENLANPDVRTIFYFEAPYLPLRDTSVFDTIIALDSTLALSKDLLHNTSAAYLENEAISLQDGESVLWELPIKPYGQWEHLLSQDH